MMCDSMAASARENAVEAGWSGFSFPLRRRSPSETAVVSPAPPNFGSEHDPWAGVDLSTTSPSIHIGRSTWRLLRLTRASERSGRCDVSEIVVGESDVQRKTPAFVQRYRCHWKRAWVERIPVS